MNGKNVAHTCGSHVWLTPTCSTTTMLPTVLSLEACCAAIQAITLKPERISIAVEVPTRTDRLWMELRLKELLPDAKTGNCVRPPQYEQPASVRICTEGQSTGLDGFKCALNGILLDDNGRHVAPFSVVHIFATRDPLRETYDHVFRVQ
jgi:hypothetical protein